LVTAHKVIALDITILKHRGPRRYMMCRCDKCGLPCGCHVTIRTPSGIPDGYYMFCPAHIPQQILDILVSTKNVIVPEIQEFHESADGLPLLCALCTPSESKASYYIRHLSLKWPRTLIKLNHIVSNLSKVYELSNKTTFSTWVCPKHLKSFVSVSNFIEYIKGKKEF
jgi:hypothetical protein